MYIFNDDEFNHVKLESESYQQSIEEIKDRFNIKGWPIARYLGTNYVFYALDDSDYWFVITRIDD